jgi:hypothetical protein
MLHQPIHATSFFLNPTFSYKCNFGFDDKVMEGLLTCLLRMVHDVRNCIEINRKIEMYRDGTGLFGFDDVFVARTILMPRKSLEFIS